MQMVGQGAEGSGRVEVTESIVQGKQNGKETKQTMAGAGTDAGKNLGQAMAAQTEKRPSKNKDKETLSKPQDNPAVNFQTLLGENAATGNKDELKWVYELTVNLRRDMEAFRKSTKAQKEAAKGKELRTLQKVMREMRTKNALLREENESELSILNPFYKDVFKGSSLTRAMLDLE
jgi:hypothetical protein